MRKRNTQNPAKGLLALVGLVVFLTISSIQAQIQDGFEALIPVDLPGILPSGGAFEICSYEDHLLFIIKGLSNNTLYKFDYATQQISVVTTSFTFNNSVGYIQGGLVAEGTKANIVSDLNADGSRTYIKTFGSEINNGTIFAIANIDSDKIIIDTGGENYIYSRSADTTTLLVDPAPSVDAYYGYNGNFIAQLSNAIAYYNIDGTPIAAHSFGSNIVTVAETLDNTDIFVTDSGPDSDPNAIRYFLLNPTNGDIELIERQTGSDIVVHYASFAFESGGVKHYATIGADKIYINKEAVTMDISIAFTQTDAAYEVDVASDIVITNNGSEAIPLTSDLVLTGGDETFGIGNVVGGVTSIPAGGSVTFTGAHVPSDISIATNMVEYSLTTNSTTASKMLSFVTPAREADAGASVAISNDSDLFDYCEAKETELTHNMTNGTNLELQLIFEDTDGNIVQNYGQLDIFNLPPAHANGVSGFFKVIPSAKKRKSALTVNAKPDGGGAVNNALSTNEVQKLETKVYPNPVIDQANISNLQGYDTQVNIIDMNGRLVGQNSTTNAFDIRLDLSTLNPGIYFLQIQSGEQVETKKIVKK